MAPTRAANGTRLSPDGPNSSGITVLTSHSAYLPLIKGGANKGRGSWQFDEPGDD